MLLDANMSILKSFFMLYFKRQLDSLILLDNIVPWGIRWVQKHISVSMMQIHVKMVFNDPHTGAFEHIRQMTAF